MANRKTNGAVNSKKPAKNQKSGASSLFSVLKKWWWVFLLISLLVLGVSLFAYEKYLDRQNVADLKQLLADFEQLKSEVEAETGEEYYIEANCGSVGKFATSYSCGVYLNSVESDVKVNYTNKIAKYNQFFLNSSYCRTITTADASELGAFFCSVKVRGANKSQAESIFYEYDTSPGQPY